MAIKSITRVSTSADGEEANGGSLGGSSAPVFSPDGSRIAFQSWASNLVTGDINSASDVFLKDLGSGAITLVSTDTGGNQANADTYSLVFSPDGTKVAFRTAASNLVSSDTNQTDDVFVKDLGTGAIALISTDADGGQGNSFSLNPVFSSDGSRIAFTSEASNLVSDDTNQTDDVFVKDLGSGAIALVSTNANGLQGNSWYGPPTFSPDGGKIAFSSASNNLVPNDTNNWPDIFVKDLGTGAIERISIAADGTQGNSESLSPMFSSDGSRIVFTSWASNLVPNDTNNWPDIFVKDLGTRAIERISIAADGTQSNSESLPSPVFSPDGNRVAFTSRASNLVPGDTNDGADVFVKDLGSGAIERISIAVDGTQGNDGSYYPVFSPDGSKMAFWSYASSLVPGDTNGGTDVFVVELDDAWVPPETVNRITGTPDRDDLIGTDGADTIRSLAGSYDRMRGGLGPDVFVFSREAMNGVRERDVIRDYQVGVDTIRLERGAAIGAIRENSSGATIFLAGDSDAIYVHGADVSTDNLTIIQDESLLI